MCWLKSDLWKACIAIAGMLLLLVLMVLVPVSAAGMHEEMSGFAATATVTVQVTPTEDATVTALNKEKLEQEVQQLKNQNEPDLLGWLRTNASILLPTLLVVGGGIFGLVRYLAERRDAQKHLLEDRQAERDRRNEEQKRWLKDREDEREKRAEERFQSAVEGLSNEREEAKIGAAILLRTFLRSDYEQFYTQTFDLAVAYLRLPRESSPPDEDPDNPQLLTTLSLALIVVLKEAFPLSRSLNKGSSQSLDASRIKLDNAYLVGADLKQAWMPQASLRNVDLREAELGGARLNGANMVLADLKEADLRGARLVGADLREADLRGARLSEARLFRADLQDAKLIRANLHAVNLSEANLCGANLTWANLQEALLTGADLSGTDLRGASLFRADLQETKLRGANLTEANLSETDLFGANLEDALSLEGTSLLRVNGLTKEQLEACKAKGAIIDEDPTTNPSQSLISSPHPLQSNEQQAPSAPTDQENTPSSSEDGSSATSSKPSLEP